jgi:hypothetical protein
MRALSKKSRELLFLLSFSPDITMLIVLLWLARP